jgi:uncharacterized RDD family membrane protein YckC
MNTINITTPQNIELGYELGSLGDRIIGAIIDWLIIIAYSVIILVILNFTNNRASGFMFVISLFFLPVVFYDLLSETLLNGQSLGKKVRDIKVISLSGQQPSFSQYLIRWVFRLIDFTFTSNLLGLILVAATEKHQRLGDIIAGTVLVKTKPKTNADDTWYHLTEGETYTVTYPEVINLKDHDIQLIKEVIISIRRIENAKLAVEARQKIEQVLNIKCKNDDSGLFLQTILADYNYLTSQL